MRRRAPLVTVSEVFEKGATQEHYQQQDADGGDPDFDKFSLSLTVRTSVPSSLRTLGEGANVDRN
jgi:hypothetical protein